ncbi:MAG: UpxY family transcription antiterminator [Tannerellaceae bacterium]|jgi:transcription antitermination factor NusG|nr:UpxY family transcription antiterminator [Tannerellaceae bacterium]
MHNSLQTDNNTENLNWYVLYTSPRAEKQVRDRIRSADMECWLPLHHTPRIWSDRVKMVDVPLFHSYLFVRSSPEQLPSLLKVYGVVRIIYYNGKPAVVRPHEIEAIKDFLEQSAGHPLLLGEEVEILTGAMKHISGKVRRIKKTYLVLYLEQLGATVCVRPANVAPAKRLK